MKENKEETRLPHGSKCIIQDESIPFIGEPQLRSAEDHPYIQCETIEFMRRKIAVMIDVMQHTSCKWSCYKEISDAHAGLVDAWRPASQFKSVQKEQTQYAQHLENRLSELIRENDRLKRHIELAEQAVCDLKSVQKEADEQESQEDAVFEVISIARMESMMPVQRYEYIKQNFNITRKP